MDTETFYHLVLRKEAIDPQERLEVPPYHVLHHQEHIVGSLKAI